MGREREKSNVILKIETDDRRKKLSGFKFSLTRTKKKGKYKKQEMCYCKQLTKSVFCNIKSCT